VAIVERKDVESMRIKDGCEISISGRNKKRILLVGVILSLVTLLTPVSLAATAGISVNKITDQSTNNVEKEPAKDTLPNVPQVGSSNDVTNNYITNSGLDSSNNILINIINKIELNSGSVGPESGNSNNINQVNLIGGTESKPSSVPGGFKIPDDLQVGDILIWDAGYSYDHGVFRFVPDSLSGHTALYMGPHHKDENGKLVDGPDGNGNILNVVEALPRGVGYNTISGSNYHGEHLFAVGRVKGATPEQKKAAADWACSREGSFYQDYWHLIKVGAGKWMMKFRDYDPNSKDIAKEKWYCSELVWAAYYYNCYDTDLFTTQDDVFNYLKDTFDASISFDQPLGLDESQTKRLNEDAKLTIDIDNDGWNTPVPGHPLLNYIVSTWCFPSVSPLEIYESDKVTIVYELREDQSNSCAFTSLSVDSDSNSNSNTASSNSNTVSYSDSKDNTLNYGSKSNTISYTSSSLNANTLVSKILKISRGH